MKTIKKEFIAEHYLGRDIIAEFDQPSGELIITSYAKNSGHRVFECVKLNSIQAQGLKDMLNEVY